MYTRHKTDCVYLSHSKSFSFNLYAMPKNSFIPSYILLMILPIKQILHCLLRLIHDKVTYFGIHHEEISFRFPIIRITTPTDQFSVNQYLVKSVIPSVHDNRSLHSALFQVYTLLYELPVTDIISSNRPTKLSLVRETCSWQLRMHR